MSPNSCLALLAAVSSLLASTLVGATAQRTFVSSTGVDNATCSLASPCRAFAAAISAANNGGEVIVLDSAGYGTVTITKSISLIAPAGIYAGVSVFSGDGVTINAGANDTIVLRGLSVNGQGGQNGINFISGHTLHIHDCVVSNMVVNGIQLKAAGANVLVTGTLVRANGESGVYLEGAQTAVLETIRAEGNQYGVYARSGPLVIVRNSTAANSFGAGGGFNVDAETANTMMTISNSISTKNVGLGAIAQGSAFAARLTVDRSVILHNGAAGIRLNGGMALGLVEGSIISRSQDCIQLISSPFAYTRGDNTIWDCPTNVSGGTLTPLTPL